MPSIVLLRCTLLLCVLSLSSGCALHTTATHWNGHVGADGRPVFVRCSTYLGCRFAILLPFLGRYDVDEMIDDSSRSISTQDGSHLRLVETETNNYWYSLPPLTWLFSPVMTSVTFEYEPSAQALAKAGVAAPAADHARPPR